MAEDAFEGLSSDERKAVKAIVAILEKLPEDRRSVALRAIDDRICGERAFSRLLGELSDAVTQEVDAKPGFGGSGYLLSRLSDARDALTKST